VRAAAPSLARGASALAREPATRLPGAWESGVPVRAAGDCRSGACRPLPHAPPPRHPATPPPRHPCSPAPGAPLTRSIRLTWRIRAAGVAQSLRLSQIIRVNGTGELADEGVPPGLVRAGRQGTRGPGGQAEPGPHAPPQHPWRQNLIDTTSPGVALHAQELVQRPINQVTRACRTRHEAPAEGRYLSAAGSRTTAVRLRTSPTSDTPHNYFGARTWLAGADVEGLGAAERDVGVEGEVLAGREAQVGVAAG
jgi:hypothetical protein